jgi:ABC-type hemin transport system substrate-binding protein
MTALTEPPRRVRKTASAAVRRDARGVAHRPAADGARIVSLVPSLTELLCDLDLAGQLVGRTGFCIHPRDIVKDIPKVGGTKDVNVDKLRALAPTHVILNIDENRRELLDDIQDFVDHVFVTHPLAPGDNPGLY